MSHPEDQSKKSRELDAEKRAQAESVDGIDPEGVSERTEKQPAGAKDDSLGAKATEESKDTSRTKASPERKEKAGEMPGKPEKSAGEVSSESKESVDAKASTPPKSPKSEETKDEPGPKVTKARPAAAKGQAGSRPAAGARPRPAARKEEKPPEPSPMEPLLQQFVKAIKESIHEEAVSEAYVNRASGHIPTVVVKLEHWPEVARLLKEETAFSFDYLRSLAGVDEETHMEVMYQFTSFVHQHHLAVRVKTDRENPRVPTVSHLWKAAEWNEREAFDLLGIHFEGHPDLRRILLPDDWVGHPLRKDYEQLDREV